MEIFSNYTPIEILGFSLISIVSILGSLTLISYVVPFLIRKVLFDFKDISNKLEILENAKKYKNEN